MCCTEMPTASARRTAVRATASRRTDDVALARPRIERAAAPGAVERPGTTHPEPQIGGIFPHLSVVSEHEPRSEAGIGALVPWADRLWFVGYVAHIEGAGLGLYEVDATLSMRRHPASVTGTFANRLIHNPSNQAIIGPHIIDTKGVRPHVPGDGEASSCRDDGASEGPGRTGLLPDDGGIAVRGERQDARGPTALRSRQGARAAGRYAPTLQERLHGCRSRRGREQYL